MSNLLNLSVYATAQQWHLIYLFYPSWDKDEYLYEINNCLKYDQHLFKQSIKTHLWR